MWRFDPPYPSFTLVMAKVESPTFDPSRLPPYRSSFLERFHPYPRSSGQRAEDIFLVRASYGLALASRAPTRLRRSGLTTDTARARRHRGSRDRRPQR